MRVIGLDYGRKRIGVAVSDPSGTLARPLASVAAGEGDAVERVAEAIATLEGDEPAPGLIVIGLPLNLDGTPHASADDVRSFGRALSARLNIPVAYQDERLSSREAESRLAERIKSWRDRKERLDAASAAVILQDYLDRRPAPPPQASPSETGRPDR